jgi:MAP/microtubule affinity-regulating kinase
MIKTPKINKQMRERFSLNFNSKNNFNNNQNKNYNGRKLSQHVKSEFNLDNSISSKSLINSKIFQKKIDDYLITRELGKGSYAVVKLAMDKKTKNKYAIKIYSKTCLIDPQLRNTVKNEINILRQIDNENVMKLYEVIDTQSNLYLVLEYINGINLLEIIKNEKNHFIKESRAKKIFSKIVQGINYCHQINIFHRDIKLENILVLKDDSVKIIDFGFGIICKSDTYQKLFCGTKSYMPPEIVKKEKYIACYSDIWSLGVLFYAMLFGVFPFKGKDDDDLFDKIIEAKLNFPEYNPISDKTKELFGKIFVVNPSERIKLDEIINCLKEEE